MLVRDQAFGYFICGLLPRFEAVVDKSDGSTAATGRAKSKTARSAYSRPGTRNNLKRSRLLLAKPSIVFPVDLAADRTAILHKGPRRSSWMPGLVGLASTSPPWKSDSRGFSHDRDASAAVV